jgi:hypothetical protein
MMYDQQEKLESPGQSKAHLVGAGASCQESLHEPDMNFGVRACKGCRKNNRHQIASNARQCTLSEPIHILSEPIQFQTSAPAILRVSISMLLRNGPHSTPLSQTFSYIH